MERECNDSRSRSMFAAVVACFAMAVGGLATGCGGDDIGAGNSGLIGVQPQGVQFSRVAIGETETKTLRIVNSGEGALRIFRLEFEPKEGSTIQDLKILDRPSDGFTVESGESRDLEIQFSPEEAGRPNSGIIELYNSDLGSRDEDPLTVDVGALANSPRMDVSPETVRFPRIPAGEEDTREVTVQNIGDAPLKIYGKPKISGTSDFQVRNADESYPVTLEPIGEAEGPDEREARTFRFQVQYKPSRDGSDQGTLLIESNENPGATPESPSIREVEVNANAESPCLLVDSAALNLGAVPLGGKTVEPITVESCGSETLAIEDIELGNNSNKNEFSLNLESRDGNDDGALDEPVRLENGERTSFLVEYSPQDAGTDEARVVIHSNDPAQREAEIDLVARGAEGQCPETEVWARIKGSNSGFRPSSPITAAPLDTIVLSGTESEDPDGQIVEYQWRVLEKPEDSTVRLQSAEGDEGNQAKREFRLLTAGDYKIGLKVKDNDGFSSCQEGVFEVRAIPNEKVHVELTWTNPEDPNEDDEDGSDVDVHMVKMGPGNWFEAPYDIYFRNPNNGGSGGSGIWNPENPSLDIDDTEGRGPENIQMDDPANCQWYAVGVHYYEQKFGTAYATIRIYINENLVFEKLNQPLQNGGEFWDVARIHWPTGRVYDADELYTVPPSGAEPAVTDSMQTSDLCTDQQLY